MNTRVELDVLVCRIKSLADYGKPYGDIIIELNVLSLI